MLGERAVQRLQILRHVARGSVVRHAPARLDNRRVRGSDTELEATLDEKVDRQGLLRQRHRMARIDGYHCRSDGHPFKVLPGGGDDRQRVGAKRLSHPIGIDSSRMCRPDVVGDRGQGLDGYEDADTK